MVFDPLNKTLWLLVLLPTACADPAAPGISSLMREVPSTIRNTHEPDPQQVLRDVGAIVDGMERAHKSW
jgi:hypothetical protein